MLSAVSTTQPTLSILHGWRLEHQAHTCIHAHMHACLKGCSYRTPGARKPYVCPLLGPEFMGDRLAWFSEGTFQPVYRYPEVAESAPFSRIAGLGSAVRYFSLTSSPAGFPSAQCTQHSGREPSSASYIIGKMRTLLPRPSSLH